MKPLLFVAPMACLALVASCSPAPESEYDQDAQLATDWPTNFVPPIEDATFSLVEAHLPGGPIEHLERPRQGFIFFNGSSGRPLAEDEAIVAIADGVVMRIDQAYAEPDTEALQFWTEQVESGGFLGEFARDHLRGRQVWLRHADGHISRYAHLSRVHPELQLGDSVTQGHPLGLIGASGLPPAADQPEPTPRLHFELWSADGARHLGQGCSPLETHQLVASIFGPDALPRYAREVLTAVESGEAAPDPYPPEDFPETAFSVDPPGAVTAGAAFAVPITWEGDQFQPRHFNAFLDDRPLGIIDAGDGAWILGAMPLEAASKELALTVGAIDPFGRTLLGGREIQPVQPEEHPDPLLVDSATFERYSQENLQYEAQQLAEVSFRSLQQIQPQWDQPFRAPLEGDIVGDFGQKRFLGVPTRPDHPRPGILVQPDAPTAVMASNRGTVELVDTLPIRGRTVAISHGGGVISVYSGFSDVEVATGDRVDRGQPLGRVDQPLQWEIHVGLTPSNPVPWMADVLPVRN